VVRAERYENAFIVALIVRKVAAIFVDSLHVGHEYHKRVAGEDARAYIVAGCFKMGLAKTMIMRKIDASGSPNPSGLDVGASVSLVPSSAYP